MISAAAGAIGESPQLQSQQTGRRIAMHDSSLSRVSHTLLVGVATAGIIQNIHKDNQCREIHKKRTLKIAADPSLAVRILARAEPCSHTRKAGLIRRIVLDEN